MPSIHARRLNLVVAAKVWQCVQLMPMLESKFGSALAHVNTIATLFVFRHYYSTGIATGANSAQQLLVLLESALQDVLIVGVHMLGGEHNRAWTDFVLLNGSFLPEFSNRSAKSDITEVQRQGLLSCRLSFFTQRQICLVLCVLCIWIDCSWYAASALYSMLRTLVITCVICPSCVSAFPFALSVQMPCRFTV